MKTALLALAAAGTFATAASALVVPNGDFSAGNTGFTSDYIYGPAPGQLSSGGEDYYAVVSDAQYSHGSYTSYGDHTTGTGLYLVANAATTANTTVYRSATIAVLPGGSYTFSAYFSNAYAGSPADIDFRVATGAGAPVSIGDYTIAPGSGVWNYAGKSFTATGGTVTLSFVDLNLDSGGNDFAIDDVALTGPAPVPEPAAWVLMIAGFGLVGVAARRRASVIAA